MLRNGGALWIDEGRPAPGLVESVKNLLEVKPTLYFKPRGFDMLLPFLEKDDPWRANSSPACAWCSTPARRWRSRAGSG